MKLPHFYTIQSKFFVSLTVAAILIGTLLASGFYVQMRNVLEGEVREKAELILAQVESVQVYVRMTLRPRMYQELPDKFIIEAMSSSFISRSVMEQTGQKSGHSLYRRVAENARNPDFEANETERGLIAFFRANPGLSLWEGHMSLQGVDHYVMARPVRFEKSCLHCHGRPEQAPAELYQQYGERGFGRIEDSVGGLDFVGVPTSAQTAKVRKRVLAYLFIFSVAAVLFFLSIQFIFKRVVTDNVRSLMQLLRNSLKDAEGQELLREVQSRDEIGAMIQGVEQLGQHIAENRNKLEEYTAALEDRVAQRTRELAHESAERTADVDLFVRLLHSVNLCQTRPQLWERSLPLLAERFALKRAAYICTFASRNQFVWPPGAARPAVPDDYVTILTQSGARIDDGTAFIAVESSEGNPEGLLYLEKESRDSFRAEDHEILRALGRQLGISAEYLGALDSILRHSDNLQSIFEGISDPLLLVDGQGTVIVTNKAARELTRQLSEGRCDDGNVLPWLLEGQGQDGARDVSSISSNDLPRIPEIKLASGRIFLLGLHPLVDGDSRRRVVHVSEVTEQRRMLEQVSRSEKMATVGKLAAGLAHEINNPLGVILCYAELLKQSAKAEQLDDLEVIVRHTRQAREVLRGLLDFARPKVASDRDTDLRAVAEAVVRVFTVQAENRGASILLEADRELPPLSVAPQVVEQILANLLLNSLDALPAHDGRIVVRLCHDTGRDEVVLTVRDNGGGFSAECLPQIFDPFFTTKEAGKGVGLGLTLIYGFLQELGGCVEACNNPEGGACLALRIPRVPKARESGRACSCSP